MNRHVVMSILAVTALVAVSACAGMDGSTWGGGVVIGSGSPPSPRGAAHPGKGKGLQAAAGNHVRSAYRFLEKGMPDKAIKELEKARSKAEGNFWFHYYMGGAFFFKAMYRDADEQWGLAFRYAENDRHRSRIRTCQSFVIFRQSSPDRSRGKLKEAVELDRENVLARGLLDELDMIVESQDDDDNGKKKGSGKPPGNMKEAKTLKGKPVTKRRSDADGFRKYFLVEMP